MGCEEHMLQMHVIRKCNIFYINVLRHQESSLAHASTFTTHYTNSVRKRSGDFFFLNKRRRARCHFIKKKETIQGEQQMSPLNTRSRDFRINIMLGMEYNTSHGITLLLSEKGTAILIQVTCVELISDQVMYDL